jgi:SulP family sulfate permease
MRALSSFIPMFGWLPGYRRQDLGGDLQAGLTVGVMLVPQGMAYSMLAGLPPIYGLYAAIFPALLYAVFGSSRHLSVGPVAIVGLLLATGLSGIAEPGSPRFIELAIATAFLAGLVQILLGFFRLGFMVNFLSHPVLSGFTSAAAFIIMLSQVKYLLGIRLPQSNQVQVILPSLFGQLDQIHWLTFGIGAAGIVLILFLRRLRSTLPTGLIAMVLGISAVALFRLDHLGVAVIGEIPKGLPSFHTPFLSLADMQRILPLAATICIISFIESLAIARALEAKHKTYKVLPNQELIALGITKLVGAFFQAFPTTGSFSRSAVNEVSGARTGISSIVAALVVVLTLLFLTPLFYFLPQALLASVTIAAVFSLIDFKEAVFLWRNDRRDFYSLLATFVCTLTMGVQIGILVGVILSLALMLYSNSRPHIAVLGRLPNTSHYRNVTRFDEAEQRGDLLVLRFDAQLYFGNAQFFRDSIEQLIQVQGSGLKALVLDASSIGEVDSSGILALKNLSETLASKGIALYLAGVIGPVRDKLQSFGFLQYIGEGRLFFSIQEAVEAFDDTIYGKNAAQ